MLEDVLLRRGLEFVAGLAPVGPCFLRTCRRADFRRMGARSCRVGFVFHAGATQHSRQQRIIALMAAVVGVNAIVVLVLLVVVLPHRPRLSSRPSGRRTSPCTA